MSRGSACACATGGGSAPMSWWWMRRARGASAPWANLLGKRGDVRDHHRELTITLREKRDPWRTFSVVFRAFDDGVGFRYVLPSPGGSAGFIVDEELTQFAFTADNVCFAGDHVAV